MRDHEEISQEQLSGHYHTENNGISTPNTPNISLPAQACLSSSAQIRKRAQRVKQKLPDTPNRWASTLNHIIRNATPIRRSMITMTNTTDQHTADNACVATSTCIEMNKVGRHNIIVNMRVSRNSCRLHLRQTLCTLTNIP